MRLPIGSSFGKCCRASASLMISTGGELKSSRSVNSRPLTNGMPIVRKYSGPTVWMMADGRSPGATGLPSIAMLVVAAAAAERQLEDDARVDDPGQGFESLRQLPVEIGDLLRTGRPASRWRDVEGQRVTRIEPQRDLLQPHEAVDQAGRRRPAAPARARPRPPPAGCACGSSGRCRSRRARPL